MAKTKDYKVTVTAQQDIYEFSAKKKNAIYIKGRLNQNDINKDSFRIDGNNLIFSAYIKTFVVSNYTSIRYIKTDNSLGKTDLLDIISQSLVDNTVNIISTYNKKLAVTGATNYNDEIDMSGINNLTKTIKVGKKKQIVDKTSQDKGFTIKSGAGDDIITGSMYSDTITGGAGKNTIIVKNTEFGNDVINLTKNEELVIDLTDCTDITDLSDLRYSIIGKNLIITIPEDDEYNKGTLTLKNYTKNILKSLSFKLYAQDTIIYNNLTKFTNDVVFNYDNSNLNNKRVLTGSAYNDKIDVENTTSKKYTINADNGKNDITISSGTNVINSGKDNDTINISLDGNYTVNAGAGENTINIDNSDEFGTVIINEQKVNATNYINFSNGLGNSEYQKKGNDLYIIDNDNQVIVKNYYATVKNKTNWNINGQNIAIYLSEQTTDITGSGKIYGTVNDDNITINGKKAVTIYAGKGNDTIGYAKGNRTFYFYEGDGNDVIIKGDGVDILRFKTGTQVTNKLESNVEGNTDLIIFYGNKGDSVTLKNYDSQSKMYYYIGNKKYEISIPSVPEIKQETKPIVTEPIIIKEGTILGTPYNDNIYGKDGVDNIIYAFEGDDIIHASTGDNTINAGLGNNTIYAGGYNSFTTIENGGGSDTIVISSSQLIHFVKYIASNSLLICRDYLNTTTTSRVSLKNFINNSHSVKTIKHGDNVLDLATELDKGMEIIGTIGSDTIYGTNGSDKINAREGSDIIYGGAGSDTYEFKKGDGNDILYVEGINNLQFTSDIEDKTYTWSGNDLVIGYNNNTDSVTIKDYNPNNNNIIVNVGTNGSKYVDLATLVPEKPAPLMMMSSPMMSINELSEQVASFTSTNSDLSLNYNDVQNTSDTSSLIAEYTPAQPQIM